MFKCAIFDFDGTLVDTEPIWCEIASDILSEYGVTDLNYNTWKKKYQDKPNLAEILVSEYELPMSSKELSDLMNTRFISYCYFSDNKFINKLKNKSSMMELKALFKRTHSCYLVAYSREDTVRTILDKIGATELFKEIRCSVGDKEQEYKEIAELERLDFKDIALYDDSKEAIDIGRNLGMLVNKV